MREEETRKGEEEVWCTLRKMGRELWWLRAGSMVCTSVSCPHPHPPPPQMHMLGSNPKDDGIRRRGLRELIRM